ncbi:zinc finger BED domain-containing protein 5 [Trichonephila clavata]|uniref:Zinc finger BED domain-containing protein 5 n=1 Tax=Trichonephila clavata TaxID=2740835 RepID=A0A8X6GZ99_TRICU|nr:zinc finger BED domain-containing protein 5 [Trichonephila clavata]
MKPSKLQRHLNTKHATLSKKPIEYFERLLQTSNKEKNTLEKYVTLNDKYLSASYEVSYLIAKTKKPFTIGEQLLLPAAIRMSEIVHGKQYAAEISKIPLSNDTVSKKISDISNDQFQQLLMRLKDSSKFAIQLDESTRHFKNSTVVTFYAAEVRLLDVSVSSNGIDGRISIAVKDQLTRIKDFINNPDEKYKTILESKMDTLKSLRIKLSDMRNEYHKIVENDKELETLELEILGLEDDCKDIQVRIKNIVSKIEL